jgi:CheY-like chemotaxis protein
MENRLRQLHKMEAVGVLAGGIAHDFNNILFPILGYAELADLKVAPDDPVTSSYLRKIIQGSLRAKDMTSQLLSFSQQHPAKKYAFRPHLVVKEALALLQTSLPENVGMEAEISQDCGSILAEPAQYYQIVMNLCTNALQAMGTTGGVLRVSLKREAVRAGDSRISDSGLAPDDYIVLGVSDTGCGMEPGTMQRIFDPYFTTKEVGKGSGLGLSVVHGIVKNYRGGITVQSEPGKGTSLTVYLPKVVDEPAKVKEALPVSPLPGLERIVVVDDETMITSLFQSILNRFGYQSFIFNDGSEALDFIAKQPEAFDLLITDMTMPQMNGLDLSLKARAIRPNLPIILCTGYSKLISEDQAQDLGIDVFLMKPFSIEDLFSAMRKALGKVEG